MTELTRDERVALAAKLRCIKLTVAQDVTAEFYRRHPDWDARYGERGRQLCVEDECFHLEFLAGAIEGGVPAAFADYARWAAGMLSARGINPSFLTEALELIGQGLATHLRPAELIYLAGFLAVGRAASGAHYPAEIQGTPKEGLALTRSLFLQALLLGHRKPACTIALEAVREGHPITEIYAEVLQASLYEVGRLWESNRIPVAQEHMATAIVQFVLAQLYPLLKLPTVSRGNAVITGVVGELHQVGANMVADTLEADGWNVRFLGTDMPHAGILQAVEEHRPNVVGISTTMLFNLSKVRNLVGDVRKKFRDRCPRIVVGGAVVRAAPDLAKEVGADACGADLRSAPALFAGAPSAIPS